MMKLLKYQKYAKLGRAERLRGIIERYVSGRYGDAELRGELERLYSEAAGAAGGKTEFATPEGVRGSGSAGGRLKPESRLKPAGPPPEGSVPGAELRGDNVLGEDKLYQEVYRLIKESYPRGGDLRVDQIESYTNTVSARAATTERLSEYAGRGVQMVQVVAYLDHATTAICRMMHGRIFAVGDARDSLGNQEMLVNAESFWKGTDYFGQVPSADMKGWMPPYHYNCRTRVVPYIEPADMYEAGLDRARNLVKLEARHVDAIVERCVDFEFASRAALEAHARKHEAEFGMRNEMAGALNDVYMRRVRDLLRNPLRQMGVAVSARDGGYNLYVWDPRVRVLEGLEKHDFAIFNLDKNELKTFHAKKMEDIMKNLDPKHHGKVMLLTEQYISKGVRAMLSELDVKQYEYIIDYFETDDTTDEQEMFSRLRFEEEWDGISEAFKERILAVDRIVLERYADWFNYNVFNEYIDCIRKRQEIEGMARRFSGF